MSYDIRVRTERCDQCGSEGVTLFDTSITHNVNGIVELCLAEAGAPDGKHAGDHTPRSWGRLHGWRCAEVIDVLRKAADIAHDPKRETELRAMEPSNGWGSLGGVRKLFTDLIKAAADNPKAFIETHG